VPEKGKVEIPVGEEEVLHPTSVTPLPIQVGSLTVTSPNDYSLRDNLYFYKYPLEER